MHSMRWLRLWRGRPCKESPDIFLNEIMNSPLSPKVVSSRNLEFRPKVVICRLAPGWTGFFSFLVLSCSVSNSPHKPFLNPFPILHRAVYQCFWALGCCLYFARIVQGPSILVRLLGCIYIFPILNRSKTVFTAFEGAQ